MKLKKNVSATVCFCPKFRDRVLRKEFEQTIFCDQVANNLHWLLVTMEILFVIMFFFSAVMATRFMVKNLNPLQASIQLKGIDLE